MTYDKPIDTPQHVAGVSIADTIREALEGRLFDHCDHIFTCITITHDIWEDA